MCEKIDMNKEIEIGCPTHGAFFVTPNDHLGYNSKLIAYGCPECKDEKKICITKDNIAEYYEFMSDEDIHKYLSIIHFKLKDELKNGLSRGGNIAKALGIKGTILIKNSKVIPHSSGAVTAVCRFGVKDTLKPIDEYVDDIKASSEHKEYIESKGF